MSGAEAPEALRPDLGQCTNSRHLSPSLTPARSPRSSDRVVGRASSRRRAAGDLHRAASSSNPAIDVAARTTSRSRWRSTWARTPSAASPWTPPTAWSAARPCANTGAPITRAGGQGDPGPHPQRGRRAGGRARPGQGHKLTCPSTATPPKFTETGRPTSRCSRPASRSSTCSRPTPAAARSASSAAPAWARPCSSWS